MKKFFFIIIILIMIRTVGISQIYTYESTRYFSDREIANLLPQIAKVNPHIKNLNWVYPGWVVNVPIDGALVSLFINPGDKVISLLERGILETKIAEAKFLFDSTRGDTPKDSTEVDTPIVSPQKNKKLPFEFWLNLAGVIAIFIFLGVVYRLLKKNA